MEESAPHVMLVVVLVLGIVICNVPLAIVGSNLSIINVPLNHVKMDYS